LVKKQQVQKQTNKALRDEEEAHKDNEDDAGGNHASSFKKRPI
jgi:hypothetical protein